MLPHPWGALRAAPGVGLRRLRPGQRARGGRGRTTRGTTRCPLPVARSRAPRRQVQSAALRSDLPGLGGQRRWKWATWGRRWGAAAASSRPPGGEGSPPGPRGQPCMSKRVSLWSDGRSQESFDHAAWPHCLAQRESTKLPSPPMDVVCSAHAPGPESRTHASPSYAGTSPSCHCRVAPLLSSQEATCSSSSLVCCGRRGGSSKPPFRRTLTTSGPAEGDVACVVAAMPSTRPQIAVGIANE